MLSEVGNGGASASQTANVPAIRAAHDESSVQEEGMQHSSSQSREGPQRIRVAIIGGGIGGLSLATFLSCLSSNASHETGGSQDTVSDTVLDIDIYEAAPSLTELGAGVGMWLRTWRIMSKFNFTDTDGKKELTDALKAIAPEGRDMSEGVRKAFEFRKGDVKPEGKTFYTMQVPFGVLTLHRADFRQILANHAIPPARPHFGKRLVNYTEDPLTGELILHFTDGTTATCDLLVGADGIRSVTRGVMYRRMAERGDLNLEALTPQSDLGGCVDNTPPRDKSSTLDPVADLVEPVWSGTLVYRHLISRAKLEERWPGHRALLGPVVYFGRSKHALAFPIAHSAGSSSSATPMINLVAFVSEPEQEGTRIDGAWVRSAPSANLLGEFEGWEPEVMALLELVENPLLWAIHTVKPLPRYSDRRVVLLGDAAHAMTPHQGAGGGQAIEDAYVLSTLLSHPSTRRETLPHVLRAYDAVRIPVSQRVMQSSRLNGMMYEFNCGWTAMLESGNGDCADSPTSDSGYGGSPILELPRGKLLGAGEYEEEDGGRDGEFERLKRYAEAIMAIHRWEWEDELGEDQAEQAVRVFKEILESERAYA